MSLVVSDTSPIRSLAHLALLQLLPRLYNEVIIPPAVARELAFPPEAAPIVNASELTFLQVRPPSNLVRVKELKLQLDDGEAEAIALASELGASLLIDERDGRAAAMALGINVTGVVGVLLAAKDASLIAAIKPLLDRLRVEGRFFLSDKFYARALHLAHETE